MSAVIAAGFGLAVATAFAVMWWSNRAPVVGNVVPAPNFQDEPAGDGSEVPVAPPSPEDELRTKLTEAKSADARIAALEAFAKSGEAHSSSNVLRSTMLVDTEASVRLKAFRVARDLALNEEREALIDILVVGVQNPYSEVRRESIRSCRDHPHYELQDELLEVVTQGGPDRSVAVQALAFLDDPVAQEKVLEIAKSEDVPRAERIQAIALLCRTDLRDGVSYLQVLATGDDAELQRYAMEALSIWQDRRAEED